MGRSWHLFFHGPGYWYWTKLLKMSLLTCALAHEGTSPIIIVTSDACVCLTIAPIVIQYTIYMPH